MNNQPKFSLSDEEIDRAIEKYYALHPKQNKPPHVCLADDETGSKFVEPTKPKRKRLHLFRKLVSSFDKVFRFVFRVFILFLLVQFILSFIYSSAYEFGNSRKIYGRQININYFEGIVLEKPDTLFRIVFKGDGRFVSIQRYRAELSSFYRIAGPFYKSSSVSPWRMLLSEWAILKDGEDAYLLSTVLKESDTDYDVAEKEEYVPKVADWESQIIVLGKGYIRIGETEYIEDNLPVDSEDEFDYSYVDFTDGKNDSY